MDLCILAGVNTNGQLGTEDNNSREVFTKIGHIKIVFEPKIVQIPVNTSKDIIIELCNSFNLKTDMAEGQIADTINTNEKEVTLEKIEGIDNSKVTNIKEALPNYRITGNKIGRVVIISKEKEDNKENIWVNVVDSEDSKVAAKVENGDGFTVTLKADGTIWTFGNTVGKNEPEKIETAEEIIDISVGKGHTLLLGKSGEVYSFGTNGNGQLGTGNLSTYKVPIKLGIKDIEKVEAIGNTSYGITKTGEVYAWGEGYSKEPVQKKIEKTEKEVKAEGEEETKTIRFNVVDITKNYYLAEDGKVRKIVDNREIKLSLNEYDPSEVPEIIEERIMQIEEGEDHLLLLGKTGRVYSYGKNVYGQLGDNTTIGRENEITTVVRIEDRNSVNKHSRNISRKPIQYSSIKRPEKYTHGE